VISFLTNWRTLATVVVFLAVIAVFAVACLPNPNHSSEAGKLSADSQVTLMKALQVNLAKFDANNCDGTCVLAGTWKDLQVSYHTGQ